MGEARYLFRLDDACPWMDTGRWDALDRLFARFSVKPIVAVVPQCEDPALRVAPEDSGFWDKVRDWQTRGWTMGLHGFRHVFSGTDRGLVPLNSFTEFAGRPEEEQRHAIRSGYALLKSQGVDPSVWVAPAHTFDQTTLRCLIEETPIRIVSDGLSARPFVRFGMTWVPQQLWRPRPSPAGTWTICLHPNEMDESVLSSVAVFLETNRSHVAELAEVSTHRPWDLSDGLFEVSFRILRGLKQRLKKRT